MDNPYTPPTAALHGATLAPPKPASVILAIRILWITLVVGLISIAPGFRSGYWDDTAEVPLAVTVGMTIFFTIVFAVLIASIGKRGNWARWATLAFFVVGWVAMIADPESLLKQGRLATFTDIVLTLAEIYALKLLFFGEGATWFKATE